MKRELVRIRRLHGLLPLALPLLVLLLLLVGFDQYLDDYLGHREELQSLKLRQDTVQVLLGLKKNIEKTHATLTPEYTALQQKVFVADTPEAARAAMEAQLRSLLQSLYFDGIDFPAAAASAASAPQKPKPALPLTLQAHFNGVPQQLPRLENALAGSARLLRLSALELKVVDDPARSAQQLLVQASFNGMYLRVEPPKAAASKPASSRTGASKNPAAGTSPRTPTADRVKS